MVELNALLKAEDIAKWLGLEVFTVYLWVRIGLIPHLALGTGRRRACIRFDRNQVERWLADKQHKGRLTRLPAPTVQNQIRS